MPKKILSVDDSKTVRLIVRKAMKPYDMIVCEAQNGEEGLAVARAEKPDLILLDVTMPVMDGVEMLTRLKADPELKQIPVMMLTAEAGRENILKIAKIGVRDYIVKPFTEQVLVEKLSRIMTLTPAAAAGAAAPAAGGAPTGRTVFIVEDKPAIVQAVTETVKNSAWTWKHFTTSAEAFQAAEKTPPAAVVVSLSLPEGAAIDLLRSFRGRPALAATPFVGLAVKTASEDIQRAQESGFAGVSSKPIDAADLEAKLRRALKLEGVFRAAELTKDHMLVRISEEMTSAQLDVAMAQVMEKVTEAADSGLGLAVFDLTAVKTFTVEILKFLISATRKCEDLGMRCVLLGTSELAAAARTFDESKDWTFHAKLESAMATA
ncbi:MAG: response regulator [Opitutaceae bacterium]|nr:response regulator [Opitutaceae bacterium]